MGNSGVGEIISVFPSKQPQFPGFLPHSLPKPTFSLIKNPRRFTQHSLSDLTGCVLFTSDALGIDPATLGLKSGLGYGLVLEQV